MISSAIIEPAFMGSDSNVSSGTPPDDVDDADAEVSVQRVLEQDARERLLAALSVFDIDIELDAPDLVETTDVGLEALTVALAPALIGALVCGADAEGATLLAGGAAAADVAIDVATLVLGGPTGLSVFGGSTGSSVFGGATSVFGGGTSVFGGSAGFSVLEGASGFFVGLLGFFAATSTSKSPSVASSVSDCEVVESPSSDSSPPTDGISLTARAALAAGAAAAGGGASGEVAANVLGSTGFPVLQSDLS